MLLLLAGPADLVMAGPVILKVKINFYFDKAKSASVIFGLVRLIILVDNRQKKNIKMCSIIDHLRIKLNSAQRSKGNAIA